MESCLLCLELHNESINSIKINSRQWQELDVERVIGKYLWPMKTVQLSSSLCSTCWKQLYDFHKFYKRIEEAHLNLSTIMKIEIANDTEFSVHESIARAELIIEQNIKKEDEDLWNDDVPLTQITQSTQIITNINEIIIEDPLSASKEQDNCETTTTKTKIKETNSKNAIFRKEIPNEKQFEEIKPNCGLLKFNKEYNNDADLNFNSDSNNTPVIKKTTLARSKLNKERDKFITENFKLTCDLCQIPMEAFYALSKHFAKEHKTRPYAKCCNKKFFERSYLLKHLREHLNPKYFKCKDCDEISSTYESFKLHSRIHVKKRVRNCCEVCGSSFYTLKSLDMHKMRHLSEEEKLFQCLKCGKK